MKLPKFIFPNLSRWEMVGYFCLTIPLIFIAGFIAGRYL